MPSSHALQNPISLRCGATAAEIINLNSGVSANQINIQWFLALSWQVVAWVVQSPLRLESIPSDNQLTTHQRSASLHQMQCANGI
jgi:hypothetical protein